MVSPSRGKRQTIPGAVDRDPQRGSETPDRSPVKQAVIIYPLVIQVLLTLSVLTLLGPARGRSTRARRQRLSDPEVALGSNEWSKDAIKRGNNYRNQFELPVLFYVVVSFALITKGADRLMIVLAWLFVLSRLVDAAIHIGPNVVNWSGQEFVLGAGGLLAMWLKLALSVAMAVPA
jgi:hypothetical protein